MKKLKFITIFLLAMSVFLVACGGSKSEEAETEQLTIDYGDAESFEAALNDGENLEGKIVQFEVAEFHPTSDYGYNLWAGKHLNFVSETHPDADEGDTLIVKVTSIKNITGSWIIEYEKVDATVGDSTIFYDKGNSSDGRPDKNGFNSTTNVECEYNGMYFELPSYLDSDEFDENTTEAITIYAESNATAVAYLYLQYLTLDENIDYDEDIDSITSDLVDGFGDGINGESSLHSYKDTEIGGKNARIIYALGSTDEYDINLSLVTIIEGKSIWIIAFAENNKTTYTYMSDFDKIIDTISFDSISKPDSETETKSEDKDETKNESKSKSKAKSSENDADFRALMDEYESFIDEYVEFMQKYSNASSDDVLSMLSDYTSMMSKYADWTSKIDEIDTDSLSTDDYNYYIDVTARVTAKLLKATNSLSE